MAFQNAVYVHGTGIVSADGNGAFSASALTNHAVLVGSASNAIGNIGPGSTGQILQSRGASNAAYSTPTYPSASGTASKLVISDGTNNVYSTATFPGTAGAAGTILISNGTNWVASTAQYPSSAGTIGNWLTSDGTNFSSAAPASSNSVFGVRVTLTSAQVKALTTTSITALPAPGAGKVYQVLGGMTEYNYGGSNAFTDSGSFVAIYANGNQLSNNIGTSFFNKTNSAYWDLFPFGTNSTYTSASFANQPMVISNTGTALTGNAAADNTVVFTIYYAII